MPSEAVFETDSTRFVYLKKNSVVRQIVDTGEENEDYIVINKGVAEGDVLVLNEPEKLDDIETQGWEIYQEQLAKQKDRKNNAGAADKTGRKDNNNQAPK